MRIFNQAVLVRAVTPNALELIEQAGRLCYKSDPKGTPESFVHGLVVRGHESVLEHASCSMLFITDRGVSHELVRHRIGVSYSQESTRYCNYSGDRFGNQITVVRPVEFMDNDTSPEYKCWERACEFAEKEYFNMLNLGCKPQLARSVLPNSLKTEVFVTMNMRAWRHFFKLRCDPAAHPQMRDVAFRAYDHMTKMFPVLFNDIEPSL